MRVCAYTCVRVCAHERMDALRIVSTDKFTLDTFITLSLIAAVSFCVKLQQFKTTLWLQDKFCVGQKFAEQ